MEEKILIVEDEKIIAIDLERRLERFGYTIVGLAGNAEEAILLSQKFNPNVILMDIMLSGDRDGVDIAKEIISTQDIPIIFLTAYSDEKMLSRAKEVQPYGFILKPFKEREIYTTIDITLYKHKMNVEFKKQKELFNKILNSINEGIITIDLSGKITFTNPIADEILGNKKENIIGSSIFDSLIIQGKDSINKLISRFDQIKSNTCFFSNVSSLNALKQIVILDGSLTKLFENEKQKSETGYLLTLRDVTEFSRLTESLNYTTSHDNLTGLSNREEFTFKLDELLKSINTNGGEHSLLVLDVDRFKIINDSCGSIAGNELLQQIASHIQANIQRNDISARIGADDFAIILMNCDLTNTINVGHRLQKEIQKNRFIWTNSSFPISLSIGVVPLTNECISAQSVLAAADDACHFSKEEGGDKITVFNKHDSKFKQRRVEMEWISKLNNSIDDNRFVLYYQDIVPLTENVKDLPKIELLLRLNDNQDLIAPEIFIPAAEKYNLMPQIDNWVIENSMKAFKQLKEIESPLVSRIFSINLSGASLFNSSLIESIKFYIDKYQVEPKNFCFEITETTAIQNLTHAARFIDSLKKLGFTFSLDDFGSGFSSFGYLHKLPVDFVKIDGSFVRNMDENEINYTMVESINSISHVMGLKTIAEYIRNESIEKKIIEIGVDYGQGYFYSEPKPLLLPTIVA